MSDKKFSSLDIEINKASEWIKFWCEEHLENFDIKQIDKNGRITFSIKDKYGEILLDLIECKGKRYTIWPGVGKRQEISYEIAEHLLSCVNNASSSNTEIGNGFSIVTKKEIFDDIVQLLSDDPGITCVEKKRFDQEGMAKYTQYKYKSEYGDQVVIKFFDKTNRLQVQGKPLYLFGLIQDVLIADNDTVDGIVDANIKYYSIDMRKDDLYAEMEEKLGCGLYSFLTSSLLAILSPAFLFYKVEMDLGNYSCLCQPALQALEGYMLKLLTSCGVIHNDERIGNYFDFDESTNKHYLNDDTCKIVGDENKIKSINRLYALYRNKRHPYSHSTERNYDTNIITDRETADSIFREIISAMRSSYDNWK